MFGRKNKTCENCEFFVKDRNECTIRPDCIITDGRCCCAKGCTSWKKGVPRESISIPLTTGLPMLPLNFVTVHIESRKRA